MDNSKVPGCETVLEVRHLSKVFERPRHPYTRALIDAAPRVGGEAHGRMTLVPAGELPDPADPPSGCRYRTRCPFATDICKREEPPLDTCEEGHAVSCHHWQELGADVPA